MSTLVIGDVHGCARELQRLLDGVRPHRVVLVGDLFTKGPDPCGVWALIRDRGLLAVLGNHDQRLLDVVDGDRPKDAHGHACVEALHRFDPAWEAWVRGTPLTCTVAGWTVVHAALHPSGEIARTTRSIATLLRRWPKDRAKDPRWWKVYEGGRRVVFGHDARQGLVEVDRDGRAFIRGLDTGCVYGGALTGFLLEEERLVQVDAAQAYCPT
ncbi:MAG: metallophosphoesterase [Myxococcales bacterium]|nr:metallophosphoesterase [Myxococcales bacterium]